MSEATLPALHQELNQQLNQEPGQELNQLLHPQPHPECQQRASDPAPLSGPVRHGGSGRPAPRNGDLFDLSPAPQGDVAGASYLASGSAAALVRPERHPPGRKGQAAAANRPRFAVGAEQDHHFRMAMNVARRIGRVGRREQAGRLICHHLRCMLDEPVVRPAG